MDDLKQYTIASLIETTSIMLDKTHAVLDVYSSKFVTYPDDYDLEVVSLHSIGGISGINDASYDRYILEIIITSLFYDSSDAQLHDKNLDTIYEMIVDRVREMTDQYDEHLTKLSNREIRRIFNYLDDEDIRPMYTDDIHTVFCGWIENGADHLMCVMIKDKHV